MARGTHGRQGPAPTSMERSHKAKAPDAQGWITLPAEGRQGDAPEWPLIDPFPRELDLWARLWATPQAAMWEQLGMTFEVASYVRLLATAERPDAPVVAWTQVKQFAESLGLSVAGMARNRWTVAKVDSPDAPQAGSQAPAQVTSLSARLKAVADG